jgi:dTDP-4-dehydro-6-deoxy-alpha-D-glucopyranose 2,3-dehydratase
MATDTRTIELRPREDPELPSRLARSTATADGRQLSTDAFGDWMRERAQRHSFEVVRIPFEELRGWRFAEESGNLVHSSGRFFSVEGLRARSPMAGVPVWHQPIINQPEVGILGILVKEFDGVLHLLMQAKMEPGNPNLLQLSPTVQATRSNYTGAHGGKAVPYLEYFVGRTRGRVIVDVLQSEHGAWFYRKRNRNMVVEVDGDVPLGEDFCWLTLGQVHDLIARDNVINMDSRTVLACMPLAASDASSSGDPVAASRDPNAGALSTTTEILSWFTGQRSDCELEVSRIPLYDLPGWDRDDWEIKRPDDRFFKVIAVDVHASSREVGGWTQPLFEPRGFGVAAFLVKEFGGVLHVLVHARAECGFTDAVELGPTVQCVPWNYYHAAPPLYLDQVLTTDSSRIRYQAIHSEEGGRFLAAESRYLIVDADDTVTDQPPAGYTWVTIGQLAELLRHGQYINVQARTLVACLNFLT